MYINVNPLPTGNKNADSIGNTTQISSGVEKEVRTLGASAGAAATAAATAASASPQAALAPNSGATETVENAIAPTDAPPDTPPAGISALLSTPPQSPPLLAQSAKPHRLSITQRTPLQPMLSPSREVQIASIARLRSLSLASSSPSSNSSNNNSSNSNSGTSNNNSNIRTSPNPSSKKPQPQPQPQQQLPLLNNSKSHSVGNTRPSIHPSSSRAVPDLPNTLAHFPASVSASVPVPLPVSVGDVGTNNERSLVSLSPNPFPNPSVGDNDYFPADTDMNTDMPSETLNDADAVAASSCIESGNSNDRVPAFQPGSSSKAQGTESGVESTAKFRGVRGSVAVIDDSKIKGVYNANSDDDVNSDSNSDDDSDSDVPARHVRQARAAANTRVNAVAPAAAALGSITPSNPKKGNKQEELKKTYSIMKELQEQDREAWETRLTSDQARVELKKLEEDIRRSAPQGVKPSSLSRLFNNQN